MATYKLDFRNKSHEEHLAIFQRVLTSVESLPADQRANDYLAELRDLADAVQASHARIQSLRAELKTELSHRKTLMTAGRNSAQRAAVGSLLKAGFGQPAQILAVGLAVGASTKAPVGRPAAPLNLHAGPTASEGEAQLRWQRPVRRCTFEVQWHTDPVAVDGWHAETSCTRAKCLVKSLVSGGKYWFRVRATNAHGQSAWSNLAPVRVK
jgi:hypothetical protein